MARVLHASYEERGAKAGSVKVYVDGNLACSLKNGTSEDVEISEGSHTVQAKIWGLIPCFKGTVEAGTNNWTLSFMDGTFVGKFVLRESKPFYGKSL